MGRDNAIISALKALGYPGSACLYECSCEELPCPLLTWLVLEHTSEIQQTDGEGNRPSSASTDSRKSVVLIGELKDLLTALHCPYLSLTTETISSDLLERLTEFLVTELQAAIMLHRRRVHPEEARTQSDTPKEQREGGDGRGGVQERAVGGGATTEGEAASEETEDELAQLFRLLGLDASSSLSDACTPVQSRVALLPGGALPGPLLDTPLSSEQWSTIQQMNQALIKDYECRKQMMVKRFEVTCQSFTWGEKGQERSRLLSSQAPPLPLSVGSSISLSLLLAAREDQSYIFPVKAGQSIGIHKILMASVPDRGGRPGEIEPPMPTWEGRKEGQHGRSKGRERRWGSSGKKGKHKK